MRKSSRKLHTLEKPLNLEEMLKTGDINVKTDNYIVIFEQDTDEPSFAVMMVGQPGRLIEFTEMLNKRIDSMVNSVATAVARSDEETIQ